MTDLFNRVAGGVGKVTNWIKQNRDLIVTVSAIATGVVVARAGIVAPGAGIYGLGAAAGFAAVPFTLLWGIVSGSFGAILAVLGAVLSPIGLVVVAVVGLSISRQTTSAIQTAVSGSECGLRRHGGGF